MNTTPLPRGLEDHVHAWLDKARTFAQQEPGKALAAGLAAGVLVNLLPPRLFSGVAKAAAPLVRPALLALGVFKACELCSGEDHPAPKVE